MKINITYENTKIIILKSNILHLIYKMYLQICIHINLLSVSNTQTNLDITTK